MPELKRTQLYDTHVAAGATMVDFGGWEMPIEYPTKIVAEHLYTRHFCSLFDVSHMGRVLVEGPDRVAFLQHVLSSNGMALDLNQAQYAIIPNENGGAVDDAYLYRFEEDRFLLVVNAANTDKDLAHLMKIVDRFSKIGSETPLSPANINEAVGESVMYFRKRIPRNVTLDYNGLAMAPVHADINAALFEWVVENLMKNSLDALQGHGSINVMIGSDDNTVTVDVKDTGKGIPKSRWKRIFEPGFTTKTRGWGLGLSLSRRIIEDYHHGRIAVVDSEPGRGTTIRITLKRSFDK